MDDPFGRFRAKPARIVVAGPTVTEYEAFRMAAKPRRRLAIRPSLRPWERVTYSYLLRILEDGVYGNSLALVFTFMTVVIRGRNLKAIADAIDSEMCEFIQQFDADRWPEPRDEKAPFIESLEIDVGAKPAPGQSVLGALSTQ